MSVNWDLYNNRISIRSSGTKAGKLNYFKDNISTDFERNPSYHSVLKNGVTANCWVVDENSMNTNPNKKSIIMKPTEIIAIGDEITVTDWNSEVWICTNRDSNDELCEIGIIEKCNNTLNFVLSEVEYNYPCIIDKNSNTSDGINNNKYLILQDNQIVIIIKNDIYSSQLELNTRFIFNNKYAYKLTKINELTLVDDGLYYLTLTQDEIREEDDLVNDLPDSTSHTIPDDSYI